MSQFWHLLKKSLHCKPHSSEVHDPKASKRTQRKMQSTIDSSNVKHVSHEILLDSISGEIKICPQGNEDGKGAKGSHPHRSTKRIIPSSKTHFFHCDECNVFSKSKGSRQKDSTTDPPTSTRNYKGGEKLKSIDTVEERDIPEHSVIQLQKTDSSWKIIEQICHDAESKATQIECVLKVQNKQEKFDCFEECREMVRINAEKLQNEQPRCLVDGNELLRFHGTTIACSLGVNGSSSLCTLDQCGVCQILRHGFSANQEFQGTVGVFTTSTSGKAIDSIGSSNKSVLRKSVIVCRVIAGKIHNPLQEIQEVTHSGFDSVIKKINDLSDIEELNVLNPRAVLPCFVVIYKL
ncbi:uncharacterized protein LOC113855857 [Abrus precatorius]|uniref:Uncharacterized protein LOC113855857 n=1 Tax=Abrus precatorius TaxID=3816 RepID=A0A8B8KHJ2_ABRPR|nr:uncharacterized protein LOC113855857 [Abrus precatorius]